MSWADQMEQHSEFFRGVWADEGPDYLFSEGGMAKEVEGGDPVWPDMDSVQSKAQEIDTRIQQAFTDFASGNPADTRAIMSQFETAHREMGSDFHEHMDGVEIYLEDWEGEGCDSFREYLNSLKDALIAKQECLDATRYALDAYLQAQNAFRENILDLVEQTQAALDQVEADEEARSDRLKLTIVSAVAGIGAAALAVPTAGGSAVAYVAGVGAALTAGATAATSIFVGGTHKGEVICNMVDEADKIVAEAVEARSRVENALFKVTTYLTDTKGNNLEEVRPDRPRLITDPSFDPDGFHPDGQPAQDRRGVRKDDLVDEPERDADPERDHYVQDPKDREMEWVGDGLLRVPKVKEPERGRDVYEEQGSAADAGESAR